MKRVQLILVAPDGSELPVDLAEGWTYRVNLQLDYYRTEKSEHMPLEKVLFILRGGDTIRCYTRSQPPEPFILTRNQDIDNDTVFFGQLLAGGKARYTYKSFAEFISDAAEMPALDVRMYIDGLLLKAKIIRFSALQRAFNAFCGGIVEPE